MLQPLDGNKLTSSTIFTSPESSITVNPAVLDVGAVVVGTAVWAELDDVAATGIASDGVVVAAVAVLGVVAPVVTTAAIVVNSGDGAAVVPMSEKLVVV